MFCGVLAASSFELKWQQKRKVMYRSLQFKFAVQKFEFAVWISKQNKSHNGKYSEDKLEGFDAIFSNHLWNIDISCKIYCWKWDSYNY